VGVLSIPDTVILFDLDGVLIDSRAAVTGCIAHALKAYGLPRQSPDSLERFIGPPLTLVFSELTGNPRDSALVLDCVASYRARYRETALHQTTAFQGIPEALSRLSEQYRLAVATSKSLAFAKLLLTGLGLNARFEHLAAPQPDAHHEDKEMTIRAALSALRTERAVMVGDRSFDVVGAHACSLPAIGVSWGIGSRQELTAAGAEVIVDAPLELPAAISQLLPWPSTRQAQEQDIGSGHDAERTHSICSTRSG
jgi:phosphoglycolate phosphatase